MTPRTAPASPRTLSVVIPTMNRAEPLLDTLMDLKAQGFRAYELIVVDQSDAADEIARATMAAFDVPTHYIHVTDFRSLPEARNLGWRTANNDIVVYIDDDVRFGPDFLQAHLDAHIRSGAAMVAGGVTEARGDRTTRGRTGRFDRWTATGVGNFHLTEEGPCHHGKGCNLSIRRNVLEALGGFDETLAVGAALYEETELALRLRKAGHDCWFAPQAHLTHLAAPMGGCRVGPDIARYAFGMGHNRAILIYRHLAAPYRLTAVPRMWLYGLSLSREAGSLTPLRAALKGMTAGRIAASTELRS